MEKKLYRVKVVLYVMAENASDACAAATRADFDIFECVARKAEDVEPEWKDAIPYNADDERTCSEIIANQRRISPPATQIVKLPLYVEAAMRGFKTDNRPSLQN
jgi:hypothetical protein